MNYDELKNEFINSNKALFEEFVIKETIARIKRDFITLNKNFKNVQIGLECMNKHEQLYRDKYCNSWRCHSELRYIPHFNLEEEDYSLAIFTKIIADEYGYDFSCVRICHTTNLPTDASLANMTHLIWNILRTMLLIMSRLLSNREIINV